MGRTTADAGPARRDASTLLRGVALAVGLVGLGLVVLFVVVSVAGGNGDRTPGNVVVYVAAVAVGCLLSYRLPSLPIGWLLASAGVVAMLQDTAKVYLLLDYRHHHGTLSFGRPAVVVAFGLSFAPIILLAAAVMLLPDGRSPSPRWRWVSWAYAACGVLFAIGQLVAGVGIAGHRVHLDPTGVPTTTATGVYAVFGISFALALALIPIWVAWIVHQVRSLRRSVGVRRQQMKWLVTGGVVTAVSLVVGVAIRGGGGADLVFFEISRLGIAAFPVAVAVAVLRYRLYDLGGLVSRTVAYALVTAVVVGVYVGLVTLTTKALGFSSPVAVAASTLVAVAVFNPARRRLQRLVDRRFNRARYDAERTVAVYRARLRDVVDPLAVERDLLEVVRVTFEPEHAALCLLAAAPREAAPG